MGFLQPWMLWALPLIAAPIVIHLVNQRRFQTIRWAAMMFLLAANRMARGYSRLRQWLILAMRTLAVAGLLFTICRPLASGWLGLAAGGRADATLILLDRSPSMRQIGVATGLSKLDTAKQQLASALKTLGTSRLVLLDSATKTPVELESPESLLLLPSASGCDASADWPGLLQAAYDYLKTNQAGRTEIWIVSDLKSHDWSADSGRWTALRSAFGELPQGVRFHLLAYPELPPTNVSVRVTSVRREETASGAELILSVLLQRDGATDQPLSVPVQFEIGGARSVMNVTIHGSKHEISYHRIPVERTPVRGWGAVSIPADANPADNEFWFAYDQAVSRHTLLVVDDAANERALKLAASIAPSSDVRCSAEAIDPSVLGGVAWETVALVVWQSALPTGDVAGRLQTYLEQGGVVLFLPPALPTADEFLDQRWEAWVEGAEQYPVANWRNDQGLLRNTQNGASLPLNSLGVRRYCKQRGDAVPQATLDGGDTLVSTAAVKRGFAHFCGTTPLPGDSSLASNGIVLYAMIQRASAHGAEALGTTRQFSAGEAPAGNLSDWRRLGGSSVVSSSESPFHAGAYEVGDRIVALNRSTGEDASAMLGDERVESLFVGLDFARVDDQAGSATSLVQEIWRAFLAIMLAALVLEAVLCLPKPARVAGAAA